MTRKTGARLSNEDRILWGRVARTVTPLPGNTPPEAEADTAEPIPAAKPRPGRAHPAPEQQPPSPASPVGPGVIDTKTRARIAKGRLPLEARIDLHGLRQSEAHGLLLSFLHRAHAEGLRHVLVITGKGSSLASDGVLRRAVPSWFATGPFRALVGGHSTASRKHGGDGAIYVRLRRRGDGR